VARQVHAVAALLESAEEERFEGISNHWDHTLEPHTLLTDRSGSRVLREYAERSAACRRVETLDGLTRPKALLNSTGVET
jgi:hypothetical protein